MLISTYKHTQTWKKAVSPEAAFSICIRFYICLFGDLRAQPSDGSSTRFLLSKTPCKERSLRGVRFKLCCLCFPGVVSARVRRVPAGTRIIRIQLDSGRPSEGLANVGTIVDVDDRAFRATVLDPLGVVCRKSDTAGGGVLTELVVLGGLQCGGVLFLVRDGVEQVMAGDARCVLAVDAAVQRAPSVTVRGAEDTLLGGAVRFAAGADERFDGL